MSQERSLQRVLLIDSHPGDRALTYQALIQEFPQIHITEIVDAQQLAQAIEAQNFDLAITDSDLQWSTGLEVLQTLTAKSDRPVIMFASSGDLETAVAAMKAGLSDYILKSADNLPRLLQTLQEAWENSLPPAPSPSLPSPQPIENLLHQTGQSYQNLVNSIDSILWEADPQTFRFTFVSQPAEHILGYPLEQWLEPNFWVNHLHPEDRDGAIQYCLTSTLAQRDHRFEYRMIAADGHVVWMEDIVTVVIENRQTIKLVGLLVDISDRKQIETALAQEVLRRTALFDISVDGIVVLDQAGNILEANPSFARILGYNLTEINALNLRDFDAHYSPEEIDQKIIDSNLCTQTFETRHRRKDGSLYAVEISSNSVDWEGQLVNLCICRDITDRKAAEAAVRESEERFREIANTIPQLFLVRSIHPDRYLYVSPAYETIWGRSREDLLQHPEAWMEAIHPDDLKQVQDSVAVQRQDNKTRREYRIIRPDGAIRWISAEIRVVHDAAGSPVRFVGLAEDITERKHLELALQASEARFRDVLDHANAAIVSFRCYTHQSWEYNYYSAGCQQVYGYTAQELIEDKNLWRSRALPEDWELIILPAFQQFFAERPTTIEYRFRHKDGRLRWIVEDSTSRRDHAANCWVVTAVSRDITDRKAAEIALKASQQQYQTLTENSPDLIERFDTDLRHLYTSPSLTQITGISAAAFLGKTCRDLNLPEAIVNTWEAAVRVLLATGQKQVIEFEMPTLNGIQYFEMAIAPELTPDAAIASILCISRDVTDRKAVEHFLQQQAQREQALNRITQSIRQSLDLSTIFATATYEMSQLLQTERANVVQYFADRHCWVFVAAHRQNPDLPDMLGLEIPDEDSPFAAHLKRFQIVQVEDIDALEDDMSRAVASSQPGAWLIVPLVVDGALWGCFGVVKNQRTAWTDEQVNLVQSIADQIAIAVQQAQLYQQAQQEIIERQRAEAALQQLNQELEQRVQKRTTQLSLALAGAKMGTWEWDLVTNLETWSPENYQLLGFSTDDTGRVLNANGTEVSPYPVHELFTQRLHPADRELLEQAIQQAFQARSPYECEFRVIHPDGSIHWCYTRGTYILDDQGMPIRMIGICMDISDRKQAEASIRQQVRQEQLLRRVTQEIRQSLDLEDTLATAVTEVRQTLQADRVAVYRFNLDWSGSFIAESVEEEWVSLVNSPTPRVYQDTYLQETEGGRYKHHESFAVTDIYTVGHQPCHIALLEQFQARAYAIAPIFSGGNLWGLLAIYQNAVPRRWQTWEIELLQQIAEQLAIAIQQSELYRQLQTELRERQQIEEQLRTSLKEKEVLLREIYHRVKNNMQMVSSLLHLQSDSVDNPAVLKLLRESQQRVKTMSLIHERLYRSKNLAYINAANYMRDLVENLVRSYTPVQSRIRVTLELADLELDLDTAVPCGLIINELVSNALKYAFPEQHGEIKLQFWLEDTGNYCLIVKDDGIGIAASIDPQQTDSLGMQLVYGLTEQLGGMIKLDSQAGSQFKVTFRKKISPC